MHCFTLVSKIAKQYIWYYRADGMQLLKSLNVSFLLKCILLGLVCHLTGCSLQKPRIYPPSESSSNKSYHDFRLRYNAIYHVDELLAKAEKAMLREELIFKKFNLIGEPSPEYNTELKDAIEKLLKILPEVDNLHLREELYYKVGKAYYLLSDFYTADAYFDLVKHTISDGIVFWKANALREIGKKNEALRYVNQINTDDYSSKSRSWLYAIKANLYEDFEMTDSATYFLEKAISSKYTKQYKPYWFLRLGTMYSVTNPNQAIAYFKKIARSNRAPSLVKLKAELELINMQNESLDDALHSFEKTKKKGYTIGLEYLIDAAKAKTYRQVNQVDSTTFYLDKVVLEENAPVSFKNLERWSHAQFLIRHNDFKNAKVYLSEIDNDYLSLLDTFAQTLIPKHSKWLPLLEKVVNRNAIDSLSPQNYDALYELATFYREIGLNDKAKQILQNLVRLTDFKNLNYLHDLQLLDPDNIDVSNSLYTYKLLIKEKYYKTHDEIFIDLENEKFTDVINRADSILGTHMFDKFEMSQLAYLRALAIGYSQPIDSLRFAFENIVANYGEYPISKVVRRHLQFIVDNESDFKQRKYALERPKQQIYASNLYELEENQLVSHQKDTLSSNTGTFIEYQLPEHEPYYYVVLVPEVKFNLASTRYGIGQFLRTRYANKGYGHSLFELNATYQVIKIGVFENLTMAKDFENKIVGLLPEIIKYREKKYSTFVIPKSILDRTKDISDIDNFIEKYISK